MKVSLKSKQKSTKRQQVQPWPSSMQKVLVLLWLNSGACNEKNSMRPTPCQKPVLTYFFGLLFNEQCLLELKIKTGKKKEVNVANKLPDYSKMKKKKKNTILLQIMRLLALILEHITRCLIVFKFFNPTIFSKHSLEYDFKQDVFFL